MEVTIFYFSFGLIMEIEKLTKSELRSIGIAVKGYGNLGKFAKSVPVPVSTLRYIMLKGSGDSATIELIRKTLQNI